MEEISNHSAALVNIARDAAFRLWSLSDRLTKSESEINRDVAREVCKFLTQNGVLQMVCADVAAVRLLAGLNPPIDPAKLIEDLRELQRVCSGNNRFGSGPLSGDTGELRAIHETLHKLTTEVASLKGQNGLASKDARQSPARRVNGGFGRRVRLVRFAG